jgi:5-methylthioadenosine/S-adenosylhomocysteine deaminase
MCVKCNGFTIRPTSASFICDEASVSKPSRRTFLKTGALAVAVAGQAVPAASQTAEAGNELQRVQAAPRILIKGGVVLSMDPQVGDHASADVLIEDGKIREVRPDISAADAIVVDAANRIIVPGFIDTHHHCYQALLRNILPNGLLDPDYGRDIADRLTAVYTPDDVYLGTLLSAIGILDMGTTTVLDISQVNHSPEHSDEGVRALRDAGLRAVYAYSRGAGPKAMYPKDIGRLQKAYFNSTDQLLTLALGSGLNKDLFTAAREAGVFTANHGVNHRTEKALHDLAAAGLLRPGDEYIHCTQLSPDSWKVIRDSGGKVSLSTPIEMAMGHGMPGIQGALDAGVRPSLSSDVDVTFAQDPFTVMRSTLSLQRLMILQRMQKNEPNLPKLLTTRDVLEFATIEGARCLGLESKTGSLTPGKDADIVVLDAERLNVWPLNNATGCVVNLMGTGNVESVFVAGKVKKWKGSMVGFDEARMRSGTAQARDGVIRRANFPVNLFG